MTAIGPVAASTAEARSQGRLVTRAGSQANRYSIELGEAVQSLVRATACEPAIPASELLVVLGHISTAGYGLAQGLQQLASCLRRSTEEGLYWATGEDVAPSERAAAHLSVAAAAKSLESASRRAEQWAELTGRARREITAEAEAVERRLIKRRGGVRVADADPEPEPEDVPVEWLTPEEAADLIQVNPSTLRSGQWRRRVGAPEGQKDEQRRLRFRADDVLAFSRRRGAA